MANTYTLETAKNNGRYMYLTLTQTADIATNTSTIKWTLTTTGGSSNYYSTGATTVKINNEQVYYKKRVEWSDKIFPAAKGSVSGSLTVAHNDDGTLTIPVSLSTAIQVAAITTVSGNWTLDSIPRGGEIKTAPDFNDEENPTITYVNQTGANVDSLQACITFDGSNDDIAYRDISKTGTSYTFNLTDAERKVLRQGVTSGTSRKVRFYIKSVIDGNTFYSRSGEKTFTLLNATPTMSPVVVDTGSRSIALTGNPNTIIKGYNIVSVAINATGRKEGVVKYYAIINGDTYLDTSTATIGYTENNVFTLKATDNRGNNVTQTITLPMINYINLTCNLSADIELTGGENAKITLNMDGNYWGGSFGAVNNSLTVKYRYKVKGGSYGEWISAEGANIQNSKYTCTAVIENLDYQKTYIVQAAAFDEVKHTGVMSAEITKKAIPVFDWSAEDFNFNVPVSIGGVVIDYIVEQGTKSGWTYRKWNSGKAECWKILEFKTTINTAFGALYCGNATARQDYPFTFAAKPVEQVTLQCGNTQGILYTEAGGHGVNGVSSTARYNVFRPSAVTSSETFYLSFYVIGNWK